MYYELDYLYFIMYNELSLWVKKGTSIKIEYKSLGKNKTGQIGNQVLDWQQVLAT